MKRAEREHLKEDPFEIFVYNALNHLKTYRKQITIGALVVVALVAVLVASLFFMHQAEKRDNQLFAEGMKIVDSVALTSEQKIDELKDLPLTHKGKSAVLILNLANLYLSISDLPSAQALLDKTPAFSIPVLEDQRQLLTTSLLAEAGKTNESVDLLQRLLAAKSGTLNRDMLLFRLAELQTVAGNKEAAKEQYKRLTQEYPQSMFAYRAQQALENLQ
jgi:tetratricopeptide (TPR) repeat protein